MHKPNAFQITTDAVIDTIVKLAANRQRLEFEQSQKDETLMEFSQADVAEIQTCATKTLNSRSIGSYFATIKGGLTLKIGKQSARDDPTARKLTIIVILTPNSTLQKQLVPVYMSKGPEVHRDTLAGIAEKLLTTALGPTVTIHRALRVWLLNYIAVFPHDWTPPKLINNDQFQTFSFTANAGDPL